MPKLNIIPAKKMIKILKLLGFKLMRVKGSHHFFLNSETGRTATIPIHRNSDLSAGILKEILKDIELNVEEYEKLRRKI
ncbi:type II toxin-antitoxin system HicA family toxin [Candidatus Parcubacteria bacterium]|nr:type II toxin-antitoxin system HicA family toxin [Candidatus Parcubacteria bacterium]